MPRTTTTRLILRGRADASRRAGSAGVLVDLDVGLARPEVGARGAGAVGARLVDAHAEERAPVLVGQLALAPELDLHPPHPGEPARHLRPGHEVHALALARLQLRGRRLEVDLR